MALLLPTISHLTERQRQLFFLFHTVIARHQPDPLARLIDEDVAEAAASVAATLETASRGVLYEHAPASLTAQRLSREMTAVITEMRDKGTRIYDGEAAIAARAIERGARELHTREADDTAYISLVARLLQIRVQPGENRAAPGSSLILP